MPIRDREGYPPIPRKRDLTITLNEHQIEIARQIALQTIGEENISALIRFWIVQSDPKNKK